MLYTNIVSKKFRLTVTLSYQPKYTTPSLELVENWFSQLWMTVEVFISSFLKPIQALIRYVILKFQTPRLQNYDENILAWKPIQFKSMWVCDLMSLTFCSCIIINSCIGSCCIHLYAFLLKVNIRGPKDDVEKCKQFLVKLSNEKQLSSLTAEVRAKPEHHKFLIGRQGNDRRLFSILGRILFSSLLCVIFEIAMNHF